MSRRKRVGDSCGCSISISLPQECLEKTGGTSFGKPIERRDLTDRHGQGQAYVWYSSENESKRNVFYYARLTSSFQMNEYAQ